MSPLVVFKYHYRKTITDKIKLRIPLRIGNKITDSSASKNEKLRIKVKLKPVAVACHKPYYYDFTEFILYYSFYFLISFLGSTSVNQISVEIIINFKYIQKISRNNYYEICNFRKEKHDLYKFLFLFFCIQRQYADGE